MRVINILIEDEDYKKVEYLKRSLDMCWRDYMLHLYSHYTHMNK